MVITAGRRSTQTARSALWKGVRKRGGIHMRVMIIAAMTTKMVIVTVPACRFPDAGTAGGMDAIAKITFPAEGSGRERYF